MPLRDHFRSPVDDRHSWDELHGQWPAMIVQWLSNRLPDGYIAAPGVHLGSGFEIDVSAYESDDRTAGGSDGDGGVATWSAPAPTLTAEAELVIPDEYEVRIYDARRGRTLVAAIEIVSPSNKDRPESRRAFVTKCAALLRKGVCVSVVDVVTVRAFNLYADLLAEVRAADPSLGSEPPAIYAATLRGRRRPRRAAVETWFYPLAVGRPLPPLPLWLGAGTGVTLDLEASYEDTCRVLRIG